VPGWTWGRSPWWLWTVGSQGRRGYRSGTVDRWEVMRDDQLNERITSPQSWCPFQSLDRTMSTHEAVLRRKGEQGEGPSQSVVSAQSTRSSASPSSHSSHTASLPSHPLQGAVNHITHTSVSGIVSLRNEFQRNLLHPFPLPSPVSHRLICPELDLLSSGCRGGEEGESRGGDEKGENE
jgi:hypothetical protein